MHARLANLHAKVEWSGRAGLLAVSLNSNKQFALLLVHGCHSYLEESLTDASYLLRLRKAGAVTLACGDWNVDLLPTLELDPWRHVNARSQHHLLRRCVLDGWASASKLNLCLPSSVDGVPDGRFADVCATVPITRIPSDEQASSLGQLPSLLDFGFCSGKSARELIASWRLRLSDHAAMLFTVSCPFEARRF